MNERHEQAPAESSQPPHKASDGSGQADQQPRVVKAQDHSRHAVCEDVLIGEAAGEGPAPPAGKGGEEAEQEGGPWADAEGSHGKAGREGHRPPGQEEAKGIGQADGEQAGDEMSHGGFHWCIRA